MFIIEIVFVNEDGEQQLLTKCDNCETTLVDKDQQADLNGKMFLTNIIVLLYYELTNVL